MKRIVWIIIFIICCGCATVKTSELMVLGTVHHPTPNVNSDSIYNTLSNFDPDVILMEADSIHFNTDFSFKKSYDENEWHAVLKYKKEKPSVEIRPIDFPNRDIYRKSVGLYPEAGKIFQELNRLNNLGLLSKLEQQLWDAFELAWKQTDSIARGPLKTINNAASDTIIDRMLDYQYMRLLDIVGNRDEFSEQYLTDAKQDTISYAAYFKKWCQFEQKVRNQAMAENVVRNVKTFNNKKIIVLVGFKHRVPILRHLNKSNGFKTINIIDM